MDAAKILRSARRNAGLSQRELAEASGVKQPAIARIESGAVVPRADTLDRLLKACGQELHMRQRLGDGVDRTLIREMLKMTPQQRVETGVLAAGAIGGLIGKARMR